MKDLDRKITLEKQGFLYDGVYRELSDRAILLIGSRPEEAAAGSHVYRDIHEAFNSPELTGASLGQPVTLYMAPDVYWIDDPKAMDTMQKREGYPVPFGMYVTCKALNIVGLSENPEDVVIAGNRGQSHACNGNYTMIHFQVQELNVSNITIGNYCSVDLVYPIDPSKNYPKRTETITQAQLAFQQGDKLYAKKCRFVSRLNLNPICGAERALYESCHFESTDDALNGNAVYLDCDFDFYGNRPIYQAGKTGAVFIDCLFRSRIKGGDGESYQYLTKEGGPVTVINCQYESDDNVRPDWTKYPMISLKCYQYQVTQNKKPIVIGGEDAVATVLLNGKKALEAYLFERDGKSHANLGNLLGGDDNWDPVGVLKAAQSKGKTGIPTLLCLTADQTNIVSGERTATLTAQSYLFSHEPCGEKVTFSLCKEDEAFISLRPNGDNTCTVEGHNRSPEAKEAVIHAYTDSGLEAAVAVTVEPYLLDAPEFAQEPALVKNGKAVMLQYELSSAERADTSDISWYRCDGPKGEGAVLCAVTKRSIPLRTFHLTEADEGKYLKAVIIPKMKGSLAGEAAAVLMTEPIKGEETDKNHMFTDFSDVPHENLTGLRKGSWTPDCARPADIEINSAAFGSWTMDESVSAWKYGETGNGSIGFGLYQNTQGARLRYTPAAEHGGDMRMTVKADPAKTAGQGFGSAWQYLDLGIKFDTKNLSGYALRIIRVKEASDAVAMALVEYKEGKSNYLTDLKQTSCFLTGCTLQVMLQGRKLTAVASTDTPQPAHKAEKGYVHEVKLEAKVAGKPYGGILIWHTGTPGTGGWQNTTMLHSVEVEYGD